MKPSEYLMGNEWKNKSKHDVFLVRVEYNKMNNFDKRFIDQEELKDKINNEFELHRTIFKHKAIFTEKGFNNLKKKILELIDK